MKRILGPVLAAHYLAAFTALGMPLFLPQVLAELAPSTAVGWSGVLYVLPTLCTALTASAWGRLADRYGRKRSLLRAQLGLALGFAIAGFAPSLTWLVVGLLVQGTCGGSLAAANAYLASQPQAGPLARALDWTQYSARLAMVSAPALLGLALALGPAQSLYCALAVLPLIAFALTWRLPADQPAGRTQSAGKPATSSTHAASSSTATAAIIPPLWPALLLAQFLFCFAMVVTFPYSFRMRLRAAPVTMRLPVCSTACRIWSIWWCCPGGDAAIARCGWCRAWRCSQWPACGRRCCTMPSHWRQRGCCLASACCSGCVGSTAAWRPLPAGTVPGACSVASMPVANGRVCSPVPLPVLWRRRPVPLPLSWLPR